MFIRKRVLNSDDGKIEPQQSVLASSLSHLLSKCGETFPIAPSDAASKNSKAERISPTSSFALFNSLGTMSNEDT
jgi:hypothetical protein